MLESICTCAERKCRRHEQGCKCNGQCGCDGCYWDHLAPVAAQWEHKLGLDDERRGRVRKVRDHE